MDVEEHPAVILSDAVRRDRVEGTGPDVPFFDAAFEPRRGIAHHRAHEVVGFCDIGLPARGIIERRERSWWRAEPAHGQDGLGLRAHGGGDRNLSGFELNHGAIVQRGDIPRQAAW